MKSINVVLLIVIAITFVSCMQKSESNYVTISGIFDVPDHIDLKISKIEHGDVFEVASCKVNEKKEYGFHFSPEKEGFYTIGTKWVDMPIYVKGNQTFKIDFSNENGFQQSDIPDEENRIVDRWFHSNDTLNVFHFRRPRSKTYEEFFPFYEAFIPVMREQHQLVNSNNKQFNERMHALIDVNIEYTALHFLFTPRIKHPTSEQMPQFYHDFMKGDIFKSAIVLDVPKGLRALKCHQQFKSIHTGLSLDSKEYLSWLTNDVENDTLRAYYALGNLSRFKAYDKQYVNYIEPIRNVIAKCDYVAKKVEEFEVKVKTMDPGVQGYDFTYNDINGKPVSFSDFKGKYVYIDVWATWCAPCKAEIPHLKQLEKQYHADNIEFVSVSVDKPKDKAKWEKYVKDKELVGVQLFSDDAFNTRIARDYKINSIPRFLLFDTEGKIIDADAKRPSDPALKKQLNKLLFK